MGEELKAAAEPFPAALCALGNRPYPAEIFCVQRNDPV
jgi:hypothetical protein